MSATVANPLSGHSALRDIIQPQFHQNNFAEETYVKNDLNIKLDKGKQLSDWNFKKTEVIKLICDF